MPGVKSRRQKLTESIVGHAVLLSLSALFVLPFVWLVLTSLKPNQQILKFPPDWIPRPFTWSNYPDALQYIPYLKYMSNSFFLTASATFGVLLSSSLVAYGFSRIRWRGSNVLFIVMLSTMMLPPQVIMIPVFILFKELGWVGSFRPIIMPAFFGQPFFVFLLRQFFKTIPNELSESAMLDGCSHFEIYWRIILPLSKPALATVAFFSFMIFWNDFLGPLMYLNNKEMYTLSIGLQQFVSQYKAEWAMMMAAATVMTLPVIVLFFFLQKVFVQGISLTGIKG